MNAPLRRSRPYIFWGQTQSLCETCLMLVPTKIQILGNEVWYEKRCKQHGVQSTLVSTDAAYWRLCKDFIKPGVFHAERLVNMSKHQYRLEPNVSFTPDQKWVVFRSNMFGPTYAFAVEVAKTEGGSAAAATP